MGDEPGGLRIMQDNDVGRSNPADQRLGVARQRLRIAGLLGLGDRRSVGGDAMQQGMQPFGEGKESRVALDDEPA